MPPVTIYHNPRCTKSRQTLQLIKDQGVEPTIVEYLKTPPSTDELGTLIKKLGIRPAELVRKKENKALGLADPTDDEGWIDRMVANPQIIERPIVVAGRKACLGRPPENVLEIL
jgi:arsenate reductase